MIKDQELSSVYFQLNLETDFDFIDFNRTATEVALICHELGVCVCVCCVCVRVSATSRYYVNQSQLNIKDKMQPNVKTLRLTASTPPRPTQPLVRGPASECVSCLVNFEEVAMRQTRTMRPVPPAARPTSALASV